MSSFRLFLLFLVSLAAFAGTTKVPVSPTTAVTTSGTSVPGSCTPPSFFVKTDTQTLYMCVGTSFVLVSAGGTGNAATIHTANISATPTLACASASAGTVEFFNLTMTGNVSGVYNITGCTTGARLTLKVCEDATGGRTWTSPANVQNFQSLDSTAAHMCSMATGAYDGTNIVMGEILGFKDDYSDIAGAVTLRDGAGGTTSVGPTTGTWALSFPGANDTLVGKATTDTLTNKTFDTAGAGNSLKVNGNPITGVSGTGNTVCLSVGSACGGGGSSYDITDKAAIDKAAIIWDTTEWKTACTFIGDGPGFSVNTPAGYAPVYLMEGTGDCAIYWPGNGAPGPEYVTDFASGGTPETWAFSGTMGLNTSGTGTGDVYYGISQSNGVNWNNFVGIKGNHLTGNYECVIINGGSVTATTITAMANNALHWGKVTNGGTANSVTCTVNATTPAPTTATVPAGNWVFVEGEHVASGTQRFWAGEVRVHIGGRAAF